MALGLAILAVSAGVAGAEAAGPPPPPASFGPNHELELFWSDHYGLLQRKLPVWGRDLLQRHVEQIFQDVGVSVRWLSESPDNERTSGSLSVRIVLMPSTGTAWRLPGNAMGAVMDKRVLTRTLYVFFPNVLHSVGEPAASKSMLRDPRRVRDFSRALARVVTHEVVHAIDPEIPHAEADGIMSAHLTVEMLRRDSLGFAPETATRLVAAVARPQ
jgi:hypothetical protein